MRKICPKCGAGFNCEQDKDCWCENYQIHKREMVLMMEKYTDCLCPECLSAYSEK
jgi:hypothetical protein